MPTPRKPKHICIIRPDIWTDAAFNELSCQAKLLWLGLAGFLDCEGRALFDPHHIAGEIFPGQSVPVHDLFEELQIMDLIALYEVDGQTYIQMADFPRRQRKDRRRLSRLPDRDGNIASNQGRAAVGATPATTRDRNGTRPEGKAHGGFPGIAQPRAQGGTIPADPTDITRRRRHPIGANRAGGGAGTETPPGNATAMSGSVARRRVPA